MIVVDASAVALIFANPDADSRVVAAYRALRADSAWSVPEHWRIEVMSTLRGMHRGGKLDSHLAVRAVATLARMNVATVPTAPHLERIWQLRDNLSAYDAAYVAIAESLGLTLVTADARIAKAGVARCPVLVIH